MLSALCEHEHAAGKRGRAEKEEDLVSLGSDDDDDDDDGAESEDEHEVTRGEVRRPKSTAERWERELSLSASTLLTPVASSRSFFKSAAAVAGGGAGAQQKGKRAK